jgi:hypothetical protein
MTGQSETPPETILMGFVGNVLPAFMVLGTLSLILAVRKFSPRIM